MPELPEVETIRRGLSSVLPGKRIVEVEVRAAKLFQGDETLLIGQEVLSIERQGKLLIIPLSGGQLLTVHLKMTGQLIWQPESTSEEEEVVGGHPEKSYLDSLPHKHTHIILTFNDGSHLYFNDLRKFGRVTLLEQEELEGSDFLQALGPEPLEPEFTVAYLADQLKQHPKQPIKSFLLDQSNIAGLGNIYADESLFRAAIRPDRAAVSLSGGEIRNLYDAIQETLELALQHGGSSSKDYLNAVGERGTFLKIANVYRRTGQDCNRCREDQIQSKKIGGRTSHFCASCQR